MNSAIYPCFWFDGNAKEAAEHYVSGIQNSRILEITPLVVMFELNGKKIMGLNGGPMFKINPSISMFVYCLTTNDTNQLWRKLVEGGKELIPIGEYPWSKRYGWLQDKFGVTWQISVATSEEDEFRIIPAMLFTGSVFGKAADAIGFYASVFHNSSTETLLQYPPEDANHGKVLYSEFSIDNYPIVAMDGPGVHDYTFNEAVSFVVNCDTQDEIDYYWDKLTEGGEESQCGWLKDKFGVWWQIVPSILGKLMSDPSKSDRVINAFMQMKKFDIEKLINA